MFNWRLLYVCLVAVLLGWSPGAKADAPDGYVYTASQTLSSFENAHPDEPWIWLSKVTYDMQKDLNVYEFKLKIHASNLDLGGGTNGLFFFGWSGDVWLTIDGENQFNLKNICLPFSSSSNLAAWTKLKIGSDEMLMNSTTLSWPFMQKLNGISTPIEINAGGGAGVTNNTSVYVSVSDPQYEQITDWTGIYKWYPNLIYPDYRKSDYKSMFYIRYISYVTIRVGIERTWNHKAPYTFGVKGTWKAKSQFSDVYSGEYTRDYHIKYNNFTTPTVPWPSSSGTLTRSGNGKVTYKAPSVSSKTGKQHTTNPYTEQSLDGTLYQLNQTESCTFQNNVYLMKNAGNTGAPWTSIDKANDYYAKLTGVTSNQTQEITGVNNYAPFYVYPCWELQSQNEYVSMPSLGSKYKQHHNKFMDALVAPGYPKAKDVKVETVDAFSRKVKVTWGWEVSDANHCDKNGKWYVFRRLGTSGQTLKIGEVTNGTGSEYSINYTPTSDNLPDYGKDYNYIVCFVPNGWTVNSESDAAGLSASTSASVTQSFAINSITTSATDTKITVNWEHAAITDASGSNKYTMYVERSEDNKTWTTKETVEISDAGKTTGSWDDTNITAKKTYYYRVRFPNVQGQAWVSDVATITSGGSTFVDGSFMASRGNYSNTVKLTWQVNQVGTAESYFTLQRRPLGSTGSEGWANIYTTHGTAASYSYDDQTAQPGSFNEYKLTISEKVDGKMVTGSSVTCDGFCMATGTMSGRVSFGSGTAVEGVKVTMRPSTSDGTSVNRFRSLYFDGTVNTTAGGSGMTCTSDTTEMKKLFGGDFTVQMWINPSSDMASYKNVPLLFDVINTINMALHKVNADTCKLNVAFNNSSITLSEDLYVPYDKWTNVVLTHKRAESLITVYTLNGDTICKATASGKLNDNQIANKSKGLFGLANYAERTSPYPYKGYMDEFRVFNRCLTQAEIERNYNHPLVGTEDGLQVYYSFDEGIKNQKLAYDFSKQNGISNGHHGIANIVAASSTVIPSEDQFSLMAYTDAQGNYMVGGIAISGDGTNYVATPSLGIHEFSPANQSRYFSMNSLVQTGVDYEDVSSFPVSGKVYYKNTTIPVKDVYIKVDGITASKDGQPVMTNSKGEFSVDVPIGKHFVSISLNGHTFEKEGRYPEDSNNTGERVDFNSEVKGLTFYDNTLVTVAGRVAGGDIEYEKPLGLNQGNANIGKAVMTLELENADAGYLNAKETKTTTVSYSINDVDRTFETASGSAKVPANENYIEVETNPVTGEFVAQLPPLRYKVTSVEIPAQKNDITFTNLPVVDATNPNLIYTDSATINDEVKKFAYVGSAKIKHKEPATFIVKENEDGSFGIKDYTVKDVSGKEHKVNVYEVNEDGTIDYKFGHPVYEEMATHTYHISASERYINKDSGEPVVDEVPLAGKKVTVKNPFATTAKIVCTNGNSQYPRGSVYEMESNTFELDSLGLGEYEFTVGYPNIQEPYTRGLTITYNNNGAEQNWEGNAYEGNEHPFAAIILGALPTGNNFVTQGPDEIAMVLRDPPGTTSSATWSKGSTRSVTKGRTVDVHSETSVSAKIYAGVETATAEGIGFMVIQDLESTATINVGAELNLSFSNMKNWTTTVTATRDISTSDGFDFNGPEGDLFIGSAKNIIFGACHYVDITWDNAESKPVLKMEDGIATGEQFTTGFAYTQNYVKNILIPNFVTVRNSLLTKVADVNSVARPSGKDPIYVTTLDESDPKYGTSNNDKKVWGDQAKGFNTLNKETGRYVGPSYTMILPTTWDKDTTGLQDMVNFYNLQIAKWENELRKNEEAKVTAIQNSKDWLIENHSFDAGSSITVEKTIENASSRVNTEVQEINAIIGLETGYRFSGLGLGLEVEEKLGLTVTEEQQHDESTSNTISYSLVEDGDDDYLTVDVFNAPDGFGPIFYTRGGATSCPYQDEVVTEYYEPGTIIMQKTVQIEKPEIEAQVQSITGIPAGGKGTFKVNIRNNSDTGEDGWFDISVVSTSNPDGLIVKMDGSNITSGRSILVPAGETMVKTFTVEQSNPSVMEYRDVKIRIASQCQRDNTGVYPEIADTTSISAFFQPACSDVHLAANHTLVNTDTKDPLILSIYGYNYSMESLKAIRLQYKGENDADFTTLHTFEKNYEGNDPNKSELIALTGNNKLTYPLDLRLDDFADKTYEFRAITVCEINGEVNNESEWVEVIRDMSRPMLIATPTPTSGVLGIGDDLTITFNEDIQGSILTKPNNFDVVGVLNETEASHEVAMNLTGENAAKTDATMDLSGKSFAASMWVNYATDGRLLMHGMNDNNFTVAIENGKLAVSVNDSKATSTLELPKNQWIYLNVSYNANNHSVSAGYASDASTKTLLTEAIINPYEGNGPVSVGGNNLTAKVQELAIWNDTRSMAQAQADMYTTKSQYTNGLMGYWQLNEGRGDVATDKARSRNLTLPSQNAWWIAGDNYALVLDGTKAPAVNIGALNTTSNDDYLVEAWFKTDEQQSGTASILSTEAMDLNLNAQGHMALVLDGSPVEVNTSDLRDGQWHHLAVNVLKSTNGSGTIYLDGKPQLSASNMPALYGANLVLGGHYGYDAQAGYGYNQLLKGAIDEVRIWKARRTADVMKNNMYNRVKADETGLVAYYPMETLSIDAYNQLVTTPTLADKIDESSNEVTFYNTDCTPLASNLSSLNSQNTAALKMAPNLTNVEFDFVASERQIKVNLNEEPYKMEGCNLYITAKNVKDAYGNAALPITWSVYVQQNTLRWQENTLAVTKTGTEDGTFTATIENRGAQTESWSLSGMPSWLSANIDGGILTPLATQALTFTVDGSLPIGTYEATVYMSGSQEIDAPLNITVDSEGEAPNRDATPGENTMTVVGQLKIDGTLSNDPKDMVAAFRGTECVGVAHPKYFSRYDGYFVMMNIYGNSEADLVYKAYDASTGTIYPSVSISDENAYTFVADKTLGSFTAPVMFIPNNEIEQDLSLNRDGWKWFSLYATPKNADASVVFKDATAAINTVSDGDKTVVNWVGTLKLDNPATMYKLKADAPYVENLIGTPTDPTAIDITLNNRWTWIGYPAQASNSLDAAFASAKPQEGDMVKNQNSFSIYTGGEWIGTLNAMQPGDGYLYNSQATSDKTFRFPKPAVSGKKYVRSANSSTRPLVNLSTESNMTMIAVVMNGNEVVEDAQVSVFAGNELRGFSAEAVRESKHFITIGGEDCDVLNFVVNLSNDSEYSLSYTDLFEADAQRGTMAAPVVLQLNDATGIDMSMSDNAIKSIQLFDGAGRMVRNTHNPVRPYTKSDLSGLPAGIYYQYVVFQDGKTRVQKMMR